jgi:hypothetical protein
VDALVARAAAALEHAPLDPGAVSALRNVSSWIATHV